MKINKAQCVACMNQWFAGDVGEAQDHLCKKHKKEYSKEIIEEIKEYLRLTRFLYVKQNHKN